jgi:predicted nucleotidyltransferase component of viral defense system
VRNLVPMLAEHLNITDQELLEKDVRLHLLLGSLARDTRFGPHLAFKGGTCLIKCYLDYPRFSTDLDFTWLDPDPSARSSFGTNAFRRGVRPTQRELETWFQTWAGVSGYRADHPETFQYGRSNVMMTAKLRYTTPSSTEGLIKVQLNFEDPLLFPPAPGRARSLLTGPLPPKFLLLERTLASDYATPVAVTAYDPREILVEKCRAILTRTAAKSRDLVDLFLLERDRGLRVEDHISGILDKARRAVEGASRYRRQAERFGEREALLLEEDVTPLLLKPINMKAFQRHRERVVHFLKGQLPAILA